MLVLPSAVKSSGAVSPEMRATASSTPVIMPAWAAFQVTCLMTKLGGAPSAQAASRKPLGTSSSMFSVARNSLREAASALGAPQSFVIKLVTWKAARAGIITGALLAIARISGETAPLLFTALNNQFWSTDLNAPMASLPAVIFKYALSPYEDWHDLAWAGALLVTVTVLTLSVIARILSHQKRT